MQPLEEFYYFAQVVEHGGYAKASRALGIPKSRLSRHVAALEARLNVRLLQRSTRRFSVTEVGADVHRHAMAMLAEADAALDVVEFARAEPRGVVRMSCPTPMARTMLAGILPEFLREHPAVRLQVHVSNRRVDVLNEGFDVALRVRAQPTGEDGLVMRSFGEVRELLVASPHYLDKVGRPGRPADLAGLDTLAFDSEAEHQTWELRGPDGQMARIEIAPRVRCHDFVVLRAAALEGLGITKLPENVVRADLADGRLERVLPQWNAPLGIAHLVFPTRRGLLPAVRALIDFLAAKLPAATGQ
ncbi:LysR family transcriptional regulator [Dyella solisilvae]|uniref:LysR family transcriptional regulator n=1 Tax=Dyella solisilvae TaxID=1920168 RepID=A0A370K2E7_9GAMM|nr:LysR family transcriptional regulator [Dyella solisilvae]RDI96819.1 LysR family transcriptional regulator [Dyella solisilvae]